MKSDWKYNVGELVEIYMHVDQGGGRIGVIISRRLTKSLMIQNYQVWVDGGLVEYSSPYLRKAGGCDV